MVTVSMQCLVRVVNEGLDIMRTKLISLLMRPEGAH